MLWLWIAGALQILLLLGTISLRLLPGDHVVFSSPGLRPIGFLFLFLLLLLVSPFLALLSSSLLCGEPGPQFLSLMLCRFCLSFLIHSCLSLLPLGFGGLRSSFLLVFREGLLLSINAFLNLLSSSILCFSRSFLLLLLGWCGCGFRRWFLLGRINSVL